MATKTWIGNDATDPGDLSVGANWSPSGVPVADDDVIFDSSGQAITAGLTALTSIALGSVTIRPTTNYAFGDANGYPELQVSASGRIQINSSSAQMTGGIVVSSSSVVEVLRAPATTGTFKLAGAVDLSGIGFIAGHLTLGADPDQATPITTDLAANAVVLAGATLVVTSGVNSIGNGGQLSGRLETAIDSGNWTLRSGARLITSGTAGLGNITADDSTITHNGTGNVGVITTYGRSSYQAVDGVTYTANQFVSEGTCNITPGSGATITNGWETITAGNPFRFSAGASGTATMPAA